MAAISPKKGTQIYYYKEWRGRQPVVFGHGWPLNADSWDAVLIGWTTDICGALPVEVFDDLRAGFIADRLQLYKDLTRGPFSGAHRPGARVCQRMRDVFWLES